MKFASSFCTWLLASCVLAAPSPSAQFSHSPSLAKRCVNSPEDRSCWGDYDIDTNYYDESPDTGVVREYWFEITNTTAALDGVERSVLTINGSFPGPTIIADWGDTVVVHVTNSMQNNGTSIHFHGIRQNYTNLEDGVASITQCPTAPGDSMTYTWKATQYGSSWYHSHFYVQAWDGVAGGIIINGPATANYDEDLGTILLADWSHETADVMVLRSHTSGPPTLDNGLINGTNVYGDLGSRFETTFTAGTRYRIRLINGAADTFFKFSIDNHTMEVIAADFVPINPFSTDSVSIAMGQRYDIIVTANATADNYWMRAIPQITCSNSANPDNVKGIVRYDSTSTADPTTTAWASAADDDCDDMDMALLVPRVVVAASDSPDEEEDFQVSISVGGNGVLWRMGESSFVNQWNYPTVQQAAEGNDTWSSAQNVVVLPDANQWVYFVIETTLGASHPMHLHGHDFWVLGQGTGTYDSSSASLQVTNTPRRDVVQLPGSGYVVIAFYTDNPGAWLMHCHIAWHTSEGLAVQLLERETEFLAIQDNDRINQTCAKWDEYTAVSLVVQDDSGL
ncbi:putative extracellular dihydrogeodin oxidase/laccase [Pseudomassariella vexata]|uniref:laccase n=1 Tax=Pseudomassariella vexata TaxID=1141098 RepID=A0A1Y2DX27_9PEZI|nr:putative extracellular dihydrogeodin oxidase/laccase [Pseudomassariella vexata]ORY63850.1 putative extracellular dihydrogeodin oxidase/laccase [Pseudomassariella vexata]